MGGGDMTLNSPLSAYVTDRMYRQFDVVSNALNIRRKKLN